MPEKELSASRNLPRFFHLVHLRLSREHVFEVSFQQRGRINRTDRSYSLEQLNEEVDMDDGDVVGAAGGQRSSTTAHAASKGNICLENESFILQCLSEDAFG